MLKVEDLKSLLNYDPDTGIFKWKYRARVGIKPGDVAGRNGHWGYIRICVKGKDYRANRLAWLFTHGDIPPGMDVDHINGCRDDNRISNLRLASRSQNRMNSKANSDTTTGLKGVRWRDDIKKYRVTIYLNGKGHNGGSFDNLDEAKLAAQKLRESLHGDFCRHN